MSSTRLKGDANKHDHRIWTPPIQNENLYLFSIYFVLFHWYDWLTKLHNLPSCGCIFFFFFFYQNFSMFAKYGLLLKHIFYHLMLSFLYRWMTYCLWRRWWCSIVANISSFIQITHSLTHKNLKGSIGCENTVFSKKKKKTTLRNAVLNCSFESIFNEAGITMQCLIRLLMLEHI